MKHILILTLITMSLNAFAIGGTGGTTGGNPKAVTARKFNADPARAKLLNSAVRILRQRIPKSCFPADYKEALLSELNWVLANNQVYYFPEKVMLGNDRYDGDYSGERLQNGNWKFFEVGAFTTKVKGSPIYFTKDSARYKAEELAMTFAQDLNDHVLQWKDEEDLNTVGAMITGQQKCDPFAHGAWRVFTEFPARDPLYAARRAEFFRDLRANLANLAEGQLFRFGAIPSGFEIASIEETELGFTFTPVSFYYWTGEKGYKSVPMANPKKLEVVFSPFTFVKQRYLAESVDSLSGIVRDPETGTTITHLKYLWNETGDFQDRKIMDSACDARDFDANVSIQRERWDNGGPFNTRNSCSLKIQDGMATLTIHRPLKAFCGEYQNLDTFASLKTVNDYAKETFCREGSETVNDFSEEDYADTLGNKDPEQFINELFVLNEKEFRKDHKIKAGKSPWIAKNVLGGRVTAIPERIQVVRDNQGKPYSVFVGAKGQYINVRRGIEDPEDDDDWAFQCFFQGPQKGKCATRYYDD